MESWMYRVDDKIPFAVCASYIWRGSAYQVDMTLDAFLALDAGELKRLQSFATASPEILKRREHFHYERHVFGRLKLRNEAIPGYVYCASKSDLIKLGRSADPTKRMKALGAKLLFCYYVSDSDKIERWLLRKFMGKRAIGEEWFSGITEAELSWVEMFLSRLSRMGKAA